jgi:hypothetical protein
MGHGWPTVRLGRAGKGASEVLRCMEKGVDRAGKGASSVLGVWRMDGIGAPQQSF